jgi:hypothetical protein
VVGQDDGPDPRAAVGGAEPVVKALPQPRGGDATRSVSVVTLEDAGGFQVIEQRPANLLRQVQIQVAVVEGDEGGGIGALIDVTPDDDRADKPRSIVGPIAARHLRVERLRDMRPECTGRLYPR